MIYQKLKRTWSNGYANHMPEFKKQFPELKHLSNEEMCDRLFALNMEFYYESREAAPWYLRLTLPLAIVVWALMFLSLPANYIVAGQWGYSLGEKNRILNWFRALGLS